jgi:hypothetical protein
MTSLVLELVRRRVSMTINSSGGTSAGRWKRRLWLA